MRTLAVAIGLILVFLGVSAAVADSYRLRPGDTISVSVWQDPKLDRQVVVGPDGTISFPLAGHLVAAGQTLQSIEAALRDKLKANYNTPLDVSIALTSENQQQATTTAPSIFITGEVNRPGALQLSGQPIDTLQAIALAGGFSPFAATSRILIYRRMQGEDQQFVFNYRDFESGRNLSGNIALRAGDVVVVPEKGLFGH